MADVGLVGVPNAGKEEEKKCRKRRKSGEKKRRREKEQIEYNRIQ